MASRWNWRAAARCRTTDADGLFVLGARQRDARRVCRSCAVRTECLAYALDNRIEFGVWGGMTERERRALLRNRPDVRSWTDLLTDARDAHYASATEGATDGPAEETADRLVRAVEASADDERPLDGRQLDERQLDEQQLHESA